MNMTTLPIISYLVNCQEDKTYNKEFDSSQFDSADKYLMKKRKERQDLEFELIAIIDA